VVSLLAQDAFVVYDRYVPSSIAFMIVEACGGKQIPEALRMDVQETVERLEYSTNNMPKEDISVFFDIPPKIAIDLLKGRKDKLGEEAEYTDYLSIQEALHVEYVRMAEKNSQHMLRIKCMHPNGTLRSIEEIELLVRCALAEKFPDKAQLFV